jgi:hypothetical protein
MHVANNTSDGIDFREGTATDTFAVENGGNGVTVFGSPDAFDSKTLVSNVDASNYGGNGLAFLDFACWVSVSNSRANKNGGNGMDWLCGPDSVSNSEANDNLGDGIHISSGINSITGLPNDHNIVAGTNANRDHEGIVLLCPSELVADTAEGNPGGNLVLTGPGSLVVNK